MPYTQKLLKHGWITQKQFNIVQDIEKLKEMTQKKELWNDDALLNVVERNNYRKSGKDSL